ncbi:translation initiation factor IF-2 N-terminal domain-containing protein [Actinokineospora pegani]|uniref:translation initiation factor IF-2 N-terminal domain-containing protein n=1 Tax=Actinokineospora pegani TaxID=2654637 RepID=UPI0012EA3695|nr:translation initiation factor IF-2 N-terminal domain-containing protein [Actinokineospora pegani]
MSDKSSPAGKTGGDTTAPNEAGAAVTAALADLPAKVRVHALAKLLSVSSKEVIAALADLGETVRGAQSSVPRETALRVAGSLTGDAPWEGDRPADVNHVESEVVDAAVAEEALTPEPARRIPPTPVFASASPLFLQPEAVQSKPARRPEPEPEPEPVEPAEAEVDVPHDDDDDDSASGRRRRRGRRGRGRGKGAADDLDQAEDKVDEPEDAAAEPEPTRESDDSDDDSDESSGSRRRRRRRRRKGGDDGDDASTDDPPNTVVHVREAREDKPEKEPRERESRDNRDKDARDEVRSVRGSTRLEAKRQRRRDGREAGRRRAPILSEAEFLARREAVDRAMVVREHTDRTQIGVLEDGVLVEHFVTSAGSGSLVGNVFLGRVQNVLPSMEAAFVDIGRGRNAVLYAGEVDWDAAGLDGKARKIEQALSTGDSVLVQVTKDPVGHKGARLTTQISLPGRFLVYVPGGGATGISRKLPENERRRLKDVLKRIVPEDAGVIIRTASEGISEEELARDVRRLQAQWQVIREKSEGLNGTKRSSAPALLYEEPDLLVKVVRDLFTEDFTSLVVQGGTAVETIDAYVRHVAPELQERVRKHIGPKDVFAEHRVDEQLLKALDRKVWLPSGGYLVIDRTEAMTVIDVNTGKYTGSGGNLEETVTRNNLEAAEEIVRQLRLRDVGGIIVIDFIDMVLESNRDLVLRRLTECLGRDRTRHQVAEVTSLGLVQMTRKRVGTGLLEAFSHTCEHCKGRGVVVSTDPNAKSAQGGGGGQQQQSSSDKSQQGGGRRNRNRHEDKDDNQQSGKKDRSHGNGGGNPGGNGKGAHRSNEAAEVAEVAEVAKAAVQSIASATASAAPVAVPAPEEPAPAQRADEHFPAATAPAERSAQDEPAEPVAAGRTRSRSRGRVSRAAGAPTEKTPPVEVAPVVLAAHTTEQSNGSSVNGTAHAPDQGAEPVPTPAVAAPKRAPRRRAASRPAGPPVGDQEG